MDETPMPQGTQAALAVVATELAVLRVLAGPQRGAELALHAGEYLIGSGDHCDVVLADAAMAEGHALLTVTAGGLSLAARQGPLALGDRILRSGETADLTLPAAVTLGATSLGIGPAGCDWAALALPAPPGPEALEAEAAAEPQPEDGEDAATEESKADAEAEKAEGADAVAVEPPATLQAEAEDRTEPLPRRRGRRFVLWTALLLLLVLAGAGFYVLRGQSGAESEMADTGATKPVPTPIEVVRTAVEKLELSEVVVERGPTGAPVLMGYIPDAGKHVALRTALLHAGVTVEDRTRNVDHLMDAVALALGAFSWPEPGFGSHLKTSYGGNGVVVIDGFLGPEVDRGVLTRRLKGDAPGVANLEFRRAGLSEWKAILDRRLVEAGLGQWLTTQPDAGMLRVSGEVTHKEAEAWRAVGQGFVTESGGWPKLAIAVTRAAPAPNPTLPDAAAAQAMVPIVDPEQIDTPTPDDLEHPAVIGVILSREGPGRVLLADGLTLTEGEILENGLAVKSVMANKVVFHNGEQEFVVYVKESK